MLKWLSSGTTRWRSARALCRVVGLVVGSGSALAAGSVPSAGTPLSTAARLNAVHAQPAYARYILASGKAVGAATSVDLAGHTNAAIPAFARKYNLPCSACHTAWPELNVFGQRFRDNGYQLGNDRDSPIWKDPSYWPATVRITPMWHFESQTHQQVDATPGGGPPFADKTLTQHGFDLSGMDLWFGGTLYKNISFIVLPSSDATASWHFESAFVRFDNLRNSSWLNVKFGKFELDNLISEKRFLFLSNNGGSYNAYHFVPAGDMNDFGLGDNQLGVEVSGHDALSYTRYGVALLSSNSGNVGLPGGNSYDASFTFSRAFDAGKAGIERVGGFAYLGRRPTVFETSDSAAIPGTGFDDKTFYRIGVAGDFFIGNLEFLPLFMHASDDKYLATSTPGNTALPAGAQDATWNAAFLESHYYVNPQFVFTGRYEVVRMGQQGLAATPTSLGNIDALSLGWRWYPIMFSRAGLAWHTELSRTKTTGTSALGADQWSTSLMTALDFDF